MKTSATLTYSNDFYIGDNTSSDKYIYTNNAKLNTEIPGIRYNVANAYFEKSDDGYVWQKIIGTNDRIPQVVTHTITSPNVYQTASLAFIPTTQRMAVPDANTKLWWKLDELALGGPYVNSIAGTTLNMGPNSTAAPYLFANYDGLFGNCLNFPASGNSKCIVTSDTTIGETAGNISISIWVNPSTANFQNIFNKHTNIANTKSIYIKISNTIANFGVALPSVFGSSRHYGLTLDYINPNNWNLLGLTYNQTSGLLSFYIINTNGVFTTSGTPGWEYCSKQITWDGRKWEIGGETGYLDLFYLKGSVADARVEDTLRSQSYYQDMYTKGITTMTSSLSNADNLVVNYQVHTKIRKADGYGNVNVCSFGITKDTSTWRFVGYDSSVSTLEIDPISLSEFDDGYAGVKFTLDSLTGNLAFSYISTAANTVCSSVVLPLCKQLTTDTIVYPRPADWWNGKTCSEWEFTKSQLNNSIAQGGGGPTVHSYIHGASTVLTAYIGGVLSGNRIYLVPQSQAAQTTWHYIDTDTGNVVGYSPGVTAQDGAYYGGVLAPNGRIYLMPLIQSSQSNWHYINTNTNTAVAYAHGITAVVNAYRGGVLAPNGRIYMVPWGQSNQTNWHYIDTNTGNVVAYSHGVTAVANAYQGGVLAPNGRIYLIPYNQGNQTNWHYIDTNTGTVVAYAHGATVGASAYVGGVLASNGRIYMIPVIQAAQSTWHYIDTVTGNVVAYTNNSGNTPVGFYVTGALSPNGFIYLAPHSQALQSTWHYIDSNTGNVVAYSHGTTSCVNNAYYGATLAPNGRIYFIPYAQSSQSTWHYIETNTNLPLNRGICTNPMFNKF
jgi:hypothetical protein